MTIRSHRRNPNDPTPLLEREREEARKKAVDALGRYKFWMFGYWAAIWVHLNRILASAGKGLPSPFTAIVKSARANPLAVRQINAGTTMAWQNPWQEWHQEQEKIAAAEARKQKGVTQPKFAGKRDEHRWFRGFEPAFPWEQKGSEGLHRTVFKLTRDAYADLVSHPEKYDENTRREMYHDGIVPENIRRRMDLKTFLMYMRGVTDANVDSLKQIGMSDDEIRRLNPTDKAFLSGVTILHECTAAYKGQVNMTVQALLGDDPIGFIDYYIWDGAIHIMMMEVRKDYQRKGLNTVLWNRMKKDNPGVKIYPGFATENGMAFLRSVGAIKRNPSSEWHGEQVETNRQKAAEAEGTPMDAYYGGKTIGHATFQSHWHDTHDQQPFHTDKFKVARQTYADTVDRYNKMEWKHPADPRWAMRWKGIVDADIESLKALGLTNEQIMELNPRRRNPTPDYSFLRQYTIDEGGKALFHARIRIELNAKNPEAIVNYLDWLLRLPGVHVELEKSGGMKLQEKDEEGRITRSYPVMTAHISIDADQQWSDLSDMEIFNIIEGAFRHRINMFSKTTKWGTLDLETQGNWKGTMLDLGAIPVTSRSMRRLNHFMEETWPDAQQVPMQRYYRDPKAKRYLDVDFGINAYLDGPAPQILR